MTESAAVPLSLVVDRQTGHEDLVGYAQLGGHLHSSQPFTREFTMEGSYSPLELLPTEATVERCVTTDSRVTVLARLSDASIHLAARSGRTWVRITASTRARTEQLATQLRKLEPHETPDKVRLRIWNSAGPCAFISTDRRLEAPLWSDIAANYPMAVRRSIAETMEVTRPAGTGKLILWHGAPGTGKTTALRALMRSWRDWCEPQYLADPERFFDDPTYITHVLSEAASAGLGPALDRAGRSEAVWRLLIAEDTDEYLRSSARRDAGAALGRVLNLADGLLGQGLRILILLTTNEETSRLHPAVVRPGRCLGQIAFLPFDTSEASKWLGRTAPGPLTLAELLEARGDISSLGQSARPVEQLGQYL